MAITNSNIGLQEPSTITNRVAAVTIARGSTNGPIVGMTPSRKGPLKGSRPPRAASAATRGCRRASRRRG